MGAGIHLASISDIFWHRNGTKEVVKDGGGIPGMVFRFKNQAGAYHDQLYWIDGGSKQRYMDLMLQAAGVERIEGQKISKKAVLGKRLWLCVRELHYISDDKPRMNDDGTPMIEHHIFKIVPYNTDGTRPHVYGDPEDNPDNRPGGDFVDYKNVENPLDFNAAGSYGKEQKLNIKEANITIAPTPPTPVTSTAVAHTPSDDDEQPVF